MRIEGDMASTPASATRRICPPLSSKGERAANCSWGRPTMSSAWKTRRRTSRRSTFCRRGAKATSAKTVRSNSCISGNWNNMQLFERTVFADVAFRPRRQKVERREVRRRVFHALDMVGLPHEQFAARSPFELSGGQMRRVALAGVLAMSPSILILDEPTSGLDADAREEFYYYLQRIKEEQGVTIVLVSHDMAEVAALADWLCVLHQGQLVMQGPPRHIFAHGDQLRKWGLAAPPLSELLALLRQQGMAIPAETLTLDEAFALLRLKLKDRIV